MKYDCSKTLDYVHERNRMHEYYRKDRCDGCPLDKVDCTTAKNITVECIDIVQKWSDEHPEKTRQDKLLELIPKARKNSNDILLTNPCRIEYIKNCCEFKSCEDCRKAYWLTPYEEPS